MFGARVPDAFANAEFDQQPTTRLSNRNRYQAMGFDPPRTFGFDVSVTAQTHMMSHMHRNSLADLACVILLFSVFVGYLDRERMLPDAKPILFLSET